MGEAADHVKQGRLDDAAAAYRRVLRIQPNEWIVLAHLGACERFAGRLNEAERILRKALVVRPEEPATLNELAMVMAASGRTAGAIDFLARATRAAPQFLQGWCNLAKLRYVAWMESAERSEAARHELVATFDHILALDASQTEFRFLRDAVSGETLAAPPAGYVAQFFDRFAERFDDRVSGRLKYAAPAVAAQMLSGWLDSRGPVSALDLGCGTGLSGEALRPAASKLVGVDLSEGMLERARSLGIYDELHRQDVVAFLEGTGPWDLVLALDVFIYVGALGDAFAAAARALAPSGRFVFSVEVTQDRDMELRATGRFAHSRPYVERLAAADGLRVVDSRDFNVREEARAPIPAVMFVLEKTAPA